jgi:hypothetical protein
MSPLRSHDLGTAVPGRLTPVLPVARHNGTRLGVAASAPQAAPTRCRTPPRSRSVQAGLYARSLAGKPVEQTTSAVSSAGPPRISGTARPLQTRAQRPRITLKASTSALLPTRFASSQSRTLPISGRQGALSCCHSPRQHGQLCPDAQPELVHHRPVCPRSPVLSLPAIRSLPQASHRRAHIPAFRQ